MVAPLNVFWFITVLFASQQMFNLAVLKCSKKELILLGLLSYCLALINNLFFQWFWLPWNLNVVLAVFPFLVAGYFYKVKENIIPWYFILVIGIVAILTALFVPNNTYDFKYNLYGIPFISFFSAILMLVFIKFLSELIYHILFVRYVFVELGKASLVIMYLHVPIQYLLDSFFERNVFLMTATALVISVGFYYLIVRHRFTKKLFLGS